MTEFRAPIFGRWLTLGMFAFFALIAIILVVATLGGEDAPPIAFSVFWLAAGAWNAYWFLFRIAVVVRFDGDRFYWTAPLRSGEVCLADIVAVRPMRLASNIEVFDRTEGRPVMILAAKGLRAFLDELSRTRPGLPVRLGWQGRLAERLPGWSGWRRRSR